MTPAIYSGGHSWYHTIDLADGTSTPGVFDCRPVASRIAWPDALKGGRCLDAGTMDGFWAFEMERRGASEVIAIDVRDPARLDLWPTPPNDAPNVPAKFGARPTFDMARRDLGSQVRWLDCSVYDLDEAVHGRFDVIFVGTLLVHLRDPVKALAGIRAVCRGELVLVECLDPLLDLARTVPLGRFGAFKNQWWRVNGAGLQRWLKAAGFEVTWESRRFVTPFGPGMASRCRSVGAAGMVAARIRAAGEALADRTAMGAAVFALRRGAVEVAMRARPLW